MMFGVTCPPKPGPKIKLGKGQKKTYIQEKAGYPDKDQQDYLFT
jgi:hypothetical protein